MAYLPGLRTDLLLAQCRMCRRLIVTLPLMRMPAVFRRLCVVNFSSSAVTQDSNKRSRVKKQNNEEIEKELAPSKNKSVAVDILTEKRILPADVETLLKNHRFELARAVKKTSGSYVLDKTVANRIVKCLKINEIKKDVMIFEANPGPGIITQALLEAGVSKLRIFEKRKAFLPYLQKLQKQYMSRLELVEDNFLELSKIELRHRFNFETTMDSVFRDVPLTEWTGAPPVKIFAILPSSKEVTFLRFILAKLPRFQSLFSLGRTQLLLFISGKEYWNMTAKPEDKFMAYRNTSVLFQIFFDIKLLCKEPKESFFPPETNKPVIKTCKYDCSHLYLVSLTPKKDLFDLVSPDLINELTFFVRHHLMKRKRLICQSLEHWIPGCTSRLVEQGIGVKVMFGELSPEQILTLFINFSSWPEYSDSIFRTAARNSIEEFSYSWSSDDVKEATEERDIPESDILLR